MKHVNPGSVSVGARPSRTTSVKSMSRSEILDIHVKRALPLAQARNAEEAGISADAFRRWFAPKFAEFLRANFASPEHVAVQFGVRNSTAHNWWSGTNRASGDTVALTFLHFPEAAGWFLSEWERQK